MNAKLRSMVKQPLTDDDGEVRELTLEDIRHFRPIHDVDPQMLEVVRRARGRPISDAPKVHIGLRLAPDVVDGIRGSGKGYNARVEKALRTALSRGEI